MTPACAGDHAESEQGCGDGGRWAEEQNPFCNRGFHQNTHSRYNVSDKDMSKVNRHPYATRREGPDTTDCIASSEDQEPGMAITKANDEVRKYYALEDEQNELKRNQLGNSPDNEI